MDFRELKARYDVAKEFKSRWLGLYNELYYYVLPNRNAFNEFWGYRDDGRPTTLQVWDNTAITCAYQRANDLHGLLLPSGRRWGKFTLDPHRFPQEFISQHADIMNECNNNILFYLDESNLARAVSASNLDLIGGTAGLFVQSFSDDEPLNFQAIPALCLLIEYSGDDLLNTCWYLCKMSGRQIIKLFPQYAGAKLSALWANPNELYTVVYGQILRGENDFYMYATLEADPFYPLWEQEKTYNQIIIYRDRVRPGESDGRGIGLDLLPTIRDLNRLVQYDRQSMAFKAYPPMFSDTDAYFNPWAVKQWAGMIIPRNPESKKDPVEAMRMPESPEPMERILQLQQTIKDAFNVDPLGTVEQPVKSATEISIRENRAQRNTSIDISRIINELPKQIYSVAAKILAERRLLTKNRGIKVFNTKKMKFVFESPLFDLQKQDDLSHFVTRQQIMQQFYGQQVAVASTNIGKVSEFLTRNLNLPPELEKTPDEIQSIIQQMGKAAAQQQQNANPPQPTTTAIQPQSPQAQAVNI